MLDRLAPLALKRKVNQNRLIIFGRYPVIGRTKTRLIPVLGPTGAADLQRRFTEQLLQTALSAAWTTPFDLEFCYTGGSDRLVKRWLRTDEIALTHQPGGDLGRRMYLAMASAFKKGYQKVVLIGTDVPELSATHLKAAFDALREVDIVLGPSTDGGYWLIASRRKVEIFNGITWSRNTVLKQTMAKAKEKGLSVHCLNPLTDMDTIDDLKQWHGQSDWNQPYLSVIIPVLDEEQYVTQAITAVRNADTEVIVVDGGSQDASVKLAQSAGARVVSSQRGRALQLNAGARHAKGRVLLFLHADTQLPQDFVRYIFETLMDGEVVLGAFGFKTDMMQMGMRIIELAANFRARLFHLPYGDQGFFLPRDRFETLGGFPEVPIAEDLFLARQAAALGKVRSLPVPAVTSARRWQKSGLLRTTAANYLVAAGCLLGKSPHTLAQLHHRWTQRR